MTSLERRLSGGVKGFASATATGLAVAICALLGFAPATALAQQTEQAEQAEPTNADSTKAEPAEDTASSRAEARMLALNEAGFAAFAEGEFIEAAQQFERAHRHLPDPILRKNAAIAWFKAGRCEEASEAAVFFLLADEMTVRDRIEARSVLGHCRLEQAEAALAEGDVERAQTIVERVAFLETDERVDARLATMRTRITDDGAGAGTGAGVAPSDEISSVDTTGWALVATGAAILAGGIGYHVVSSSGQNSSDTSQWLVPTLYGVGGVTLGSGLWIALTAKPVQAGLAPAGSPQSRLTPFQEMQVQEMQKPAAPKAPASGMHLNLSWTF